MTTINRIKYENNAVKCFDGRTKTHEIDTSTIPEKEYFVRVEKLETHLVDKKKWESADGQLRAGKEGGEVTVVEIEKFFKSPVSVKPEPKAAKAKPLPGEKKPKAEKSDDKKHMKIMKEQRVRKSPRLDIEDALDKFLIEEGRDGRLLVKGRRMLKEKALDKVAKENGIVLKGENPGHMKMNLRNILVARYKRGDEVMVGGTAYQLKTTSDKKSKKRA